MLETLLVFQALSGTEKEDVLLGHGMPDLCESIQAIAQGGYREKSEDE